MDKLVKEYLKNKISKITNQSFNGNLNQFYSTNKTFSIFVQNYNLATVLKRMNFTISEEDYINTLNELVSIKANIKNESKEKQKKLVNRKKVEGFVDSLIVAFITGAVIGIILLNLYSKIVQNI